MIIKIPFEVALLNDEHAMRMQQFKKLRAAKTEIKELKAERDALKAALEQAAKDLETVAQWLSFTHGSYARRASAGEWAIERADAARAALTNGER